MSEPVAEVSELTYWLLPPPEQISEPGAAKARVIGPDGELIATGTMAWDDEGHGFFTPDGPAEPGH